MSKISSVNTCYAKNLNLVLFLAHTFFAIMLDAMHENKDNQSCKCYLYTILNFFYYISDMHGYFHNTSLFDSEVYIFDFIIYKCMK